MTLSLEICNRYETNVVNTARQVFALANDIDEDDVLIHLDIYHMNLEEDDLVWPVRDVGANHLTTAG
jgi:D-psicose/D-tagatose/L-ribulose 3-epimerase